VAIAIAAAAVVVVKVCSSNVVVVTVATSHLSRLQCESTCSGSSSGSSRIGSHAYTSGNSGNFEEMRLDCVIGSYAAHEKISRVTSVKKSIYIAFSDVYSQY
jgi:hypothetical protein